MRLKVGKAAQVAVICCKIHVYIIDETCNYDISIPSGVDNAYHDTPPDYTVCLQDECDVDECLLRRRRDLEVSDLRQMFTGEIKDADLRRPSVY